jgi:hypothetical protein
VEENNQEVPQQTAQQPIQEKPTGLLPGQEHEDELDYLGAALFGLVKKGFGWVKHFFPAK